MAVLGRLRWMSHPFVLHRRLDVPPPLGERPKDGLRDVAQLAQAIAPDVPGEAEGCELSPECRLVEGPGGLLPQVELPAVGGGPSAVRALDQVGDDDVGVELRVAGPAGAVPEGGADEPVGFDELVTAGAPAGVAGLGGEVVEDGADGPVMGNGDRVADLLGPECPEQ